MRMRKKPHGGERLKALSALLYPFDGERWTDAARVFGNDLPLVLEIGCGKGDFITALSEKEPERNYLALERISDVCLLAVEKYARRRGLGDLGTHGGWLTPDGELYRNGETWDIPEEKRGNVRFIVGEAGAVIGTMPDGLIVGIYANFSDPWSTSGRQKRRLTNPAYLEGYRRILRADGFFSFKTDDDDLFDYTLELLPTAGFEIEICTRDLHRSAHAGGNIMTEYERSFTEKGIPIKMLRARPVK